MGERPDGMPEVREVSALEASVVIPLVALSFALGIFPGPFVRLIENTTRALGG